VVCEAWQSASAFVTVDRNVGRNPLLAIPPTVSKHNKLVTHNKIRKMKMPCMKSVAYEILGITLICIMLQSCSTSNKIYSESDIVYSTKRFELKYYIKDIDRRSPLLYFSQSIIKEINSEKEISYTAYDVLSLSSSSFKLDDKVILIIDNEAFPMLIDKLELENVRSISENTTNNSIPDSTTISVISGYSVDNRITRFSYDIPVAIIAKIKESDQIYLRYYSGPSMITLKLKKKSINKLKQLIDMA